MYNKRRRRQTVFERLRSCEGSLDNAHRHVRQAASTNDFPIDYQDIPTEIQHSADDIYVRSISMGIENRVRYTELVILDWKGKGMLGSWSSARRSWRNASQVRRIEFVGPSRYPSSFRLFFSAFTTKHNNIHVSDSYFLCMRAFYQVLPRFAPVVHPC